MVILLRGLRVIVAKNAPQKFEPAFCSERETLLETNYKL